MRMLSLILLTALLVACGAPAGTPPVADSGYGPSSGSGAPEPTAAPAAAQTPMTLAMPFIPNVQFAYYYVADKKGYFAAEGLNVTFDYNFETDVVQRVANGTVQFGMASADSVLLARAQGAPVQTVATISQQFPVVFFSKAEQNVTTPADFVREGVTVGVPGRFGANWIGLQALMYSQNIPIERVQVQEIGFAQVAALSEDKITVAAGYGNNEPIQLERQGFKLNVVRVSDSFPLASDGIVVSERLANEQPELVRKFVRASLRGMQDVIANPDEAFQIALEYIPEARRGDPELQRAVLQATLPFWQSDLTAREGLGFTDAASWEATHRFLRDSNLLKSDVDLSKAFRNDFVK